MKKEPGGWQKRRTVIGCVEMSSETLHARFQIPGGARSGVEQRTREAFVTWSPPFLDVGA
ncbi:MAG: hypothetical protein ACRD1R_03505 [Acidobacteriota bacterium]